MKRLLILLVPCILTQGVSGQQSARLAPHRVLSADLGWTSKTEPLLRGIQLLEGEPLEADRAGDLTIECGVHGTVIYHCPRPKCTAEVCPPEKTVPAPPTTVRWLDVNSWSALFRREPREAAVAAARAGGNPSDALLVLDERGLHCGPALSRVLEGRYCLQLTPLPEGSSSPQTTTIDWDRAIDAEGITTTSIRPGLYSLRKGISRSGSSCQIDSDNAAAWVLVVRRAQFARADDQYKAQTSQLNELAGIGISNSALSAIRHGVLANLADALTGQ